MSKENKQADLPEHRDKRFDAVRDTWYWKLSKPVRVVVHFVIRTRNAYIHYGGIKGCLLYTSVDFAIIDQYGQYSSIIEKGSTCQVKAKLSFHSQVKNPIFTITIRNKQGTDITGTNTMFERVETGTVEAGETRIVTYTQRIDPVSYTHLDVYKRQVQSWAASM